MEPHPLFIYGTLHPDRAPAAIADIARLLRPVGRATIQGRLYNLGEYPGVLLTHNVTADAQQANIIPGELFNIPHELEGSNGDEILARLDAYEDFRPSDPAGSLFVRQLTRATLTEGDVAGTQIACWVYTYNRPIL